MEPWGFEVEDLRAGLLACTVARAGGAKARPKDFMIRPPDEVDDEVAALDKLFGVK